MEAVTEKNMNHTTKAALNAARVTKILDALRGKNRIVRPCKHRFTDPRQSHHKLGCCPMMVGEIDIVTLEPTHGFCYLHREERINGLRIPAGPDGKGEPNV
jgi:hypothetical protein